MNRDLEIERDIAPSAPPRDKCIHEIFETQAARTPNAIAIIFEGSTLTYRQLSLHSTRFALRLKELGVRKGTFAAIYTPRSIETIVCLLGILKAGSAYVALDLDSPPARLRLMLSDLDPQVIITVQSLAHHLPSRSEKVVFLDEEINLSGDFPLTPAPTTECDPAAAADMAYVAFTSGSSGVPKGVCISHRAVIRLAMAPDIVSIRSDDIFMQFAPISFDASTFEIWSCLLNGAKLAIFPAWKPSLLDMGEFIESNRVSILWLSAGLFHRMADYNLDYLHHVRTLLTGGDVVSLVSAEKLLRTIPNCQLINGYGPTENTTFSCCQVISNRHNGTSIPIGKPVAGTECLILDEMLQPVAAGDAGELFLGGDGLASGYLHDPALTAERFIPHPFSRTSGARLYRTGDRVRLLPDGTLEFLGRIDRQVKILGYRVELAEVEAFLWRHPAVREAVIINDRAPAGEERLTAVISLVRESTVTTAELRGYMCDNLPPPMIPSDFVFMDDIPLNANGKIDQKAVAAYCAAQIKKPSVILEEVSVTTEKLAQIWAYVVGRPCLSVDENFFECGGNSLRAAHLLARIQIEFAQRVPMTMFVDNPTILGLARYLEGNQASSAPHACLTRKGGSKPGIFCLPGQGGEMDAYLNTVNFYSDKRPIYGLQSPALSGHEEGTTIQEIAASHIKLIRTLQSSGPYHLFGFCFGGLLAYETARQLEAEGAEVGFVGILQFDVHNIASISFRFLSMRFLLNFLLNLPLALAEFITLKAKLRNAAFFRMISQVFALPRKSENVSCSPGMADYPLYQLHESAWRSYIFEPFPGVVTVLRPRRLPFFHPDRKLGWGNVTGQQPEVYIVPGIGLHGESLRFGNAQGTAEIVERLVDRRECQIKIAAGLQVP